MDKAERELFKAERERLKRTQTEVAHKSGVGQGLISRIEIDAKYHPTVVVFKKAVCGIDLTLSTFYARIEGLPPADSAEQNRTPPPPPVSPADETLPTLSAEEIHTIRALTAVIRKSADREHEAAQSLLRANRRHAAETHHRQAASPRKIGRDRSGDVGRRRLKPRPKG